MSHTATQQCVAADAALRRRDRADFVWYNPLEGVPDLSVAARLNAGVGR